MALKEAREQAGLSQVQLSKQSGVNLQMIRFYEQGAKDINGAKLKTLLTICVALKCKLEDILTDPEIIELLYEYETPGYTTKLTEALAEAHLNQKPWVELTREKFDEIIRRAESE